MFNIDFTHYHEVNGTSYVSTIDHFFWDSKLHNYIQDSGVIHHPSNLSDHSPIYCKFKLDLDLQISSTPPGKPIPKPCWSRSSAEEKLKYKQNLNELLSNLVIPYQINNCENVHCNAISQTYRS